MPEAVGSVVAHSVLVAEVDRHIIAVQRSQK